jgi:hypothetical protein
VWCSASTQTEILVQSTLSTLLSIPTASPNTSTSIFDYAISSFDLITLKRLLEVSLPQKIDIPFSTLLNAPTIESISSSIDSLLSQPHVYDPVIPLESHGTKTPLLHPPWLRRNIRLHSPRCTIHTRPIYALRTRGHNPDEPFFSSITETASTYAHHIRKVQPEGPYAIAGYSLGSILAFEVAKIWRRKDRKWAFVGVSITVHV